MTFPDVSDALLGWEQPIALIKITQNIVDYQRVDGEELIEFEGVIQPLTAEALSIKPTELRSWEWLMIHTLTEFELQTNDKVKYLEKEYRIHYKNNYSLNGYYEYHLVQSYEEA